jgi:tetratricopeptide (TPR) repeat protein
VALARSRNFIIPGAEAMLEVLLRDWQRRQELVPQGNASELLRNVVLSGYLEEIPLTAQDLDEMRARAAGPQQIANLGLAALQGGRLEQARKLIHQALQIYREQEDLLGTSRCLNNLADVAASEKKWEEAIDLSTRALELRRALGDEEGEVRTLAGLAMSQFHAGRLSEALRSAHLSVELSEASAPSRDRLAALIALTVTAGSLEKLDEAIPAARRALDLFAVVRAPNLEPVQPLLREIAETIPRAAPPRPVAGSEREELMSEAERLHRSGYFDESLALISKLLDREDLLPKERARLLGARGNALQSSGRDQEAAPAYDEAAVLLRDTHQEELARHADKLRAVSLRRLGQATESERILRDLLASSTNGPERGEIIISLANIPLEMDDPGEARSERLAEALRLVLKALEEPLLGDERRGLLEVQRGRFAAEAGDDLEARSAAERARQLFLRSNSRHLSVAQILLDEIPVPPAREKPF